MAGFREVWLCDVALRQLRAAMLQHLRRHWFSTFKGRQMDSHPGWMLVFIGLVILTFGIALLVLPSLPWLGRLPGDIHIERGNFRFYFPLTTSILISVVLSAILWLIQYFSGRH